MALALRFLCGEVRVPPRGGGRYLSGEIDGIDRGSTTTQPAFPILALPQLGRKALEVAFHTAETEVVPE